MITAPLFLTNLPASIFTLFSLAKTILLVFHIAVVNLQILRDLHWFSIELYFYFEFLLITYKVFHCLSLSYFSFFINMVQHYAFFVLRRQCPLRQPARQPRRPWSIIQLIFRLYFFKNKGMRRKRKIDKNKIKIKEIETREKR